MVQAQPADLASNGKGLLLVEGVDDWHAFHHIVSCITDKEAFFDIGYCGNDDAVLDRLSSVIVGSGTIKSVLGAVLDADADTGVDARLQSIRHSLESAYEIPEVFPPQGLILKPRDTRADHDRLPVIGVWLMPDNVRNGIFEDLLCAAIAPESENYISRVVDKAKDDQMASFRDVERSKAIVKTHIAWQDPKTKNLGEAISGKHFVNLAPACKPFLDWLYRLFGEEVQS
jgi:hypothetical protein